MKKALIFLSLSLLIGLSPILSQDTIFISGYVTNELNGDPVVDHDVSIMLNDTTLFYSTVATNQNGYYSEVIVPFGGVITSLYVYTDDLCTFAIHDTIIQNPGPSVTADFEICVDSTAQDCQANFLYYTDSINSGTVYFYDQSTPTGQITSWQWNFGDGTTSNLQNPVHYYNAIGTYNVCLTITAWGGACTSVYCDNIIVSGGSVNCDADFSAFVDSTQNYTVYFTDLSTPFGLIDSWYWDFGDGNTSTQQYPIHTYSNAGTYNVCLTITADSGSCTSTECASITIYGGAGDCEADFYYVNDSSGSYTVYFYDQSTPANNITSYYWSFGDGGISYEQNPIHTYNVPGTYNTCLTIVSQYAGGVCYDTVCMPVIVVGGGPNCEADFAWDTAYAGSPVQFTDLSTSGFGSIDSWDWLFGDGSVSYIQNPTHVYTNPGTYTVCLTITSQGMGMWCIDTICHNVLVLPATPQYQLGGNVFAGMYQLDHGFAYAYESDNGTITNVLSEMIDTLGYYQFYPVGAADYFIKAEPSPTSTFASSYMPTYYGDVVTWEDAILLTVSQNVYTADINLVPLAMNILGPGQISGTIVHGSALRSNTPVEGVQIMLSNEQGEYVGLEYSDVEGKFSFTGLPYETFTLRAEVMGVEMIPESFVLSEENQVVDDISLIMTSDEIYFGPNSIESLGDISVSEIYPNPVSTSLKIDIGAQNSARISYRVLNHLGQTITQEAIQIETNQSIIISTEDLKPGIYFLEIISEDQHRLTRKFIRI